jgi:hypothetical protein
MPGGYYPHRPPTEAAALPMSENRPQLAALLALLALIAAAAVVMLSGGGGDEGEIPLVTGTGTEGTPEPGPVIPAVSQIERPTAPEPRVVDPDGPRTVPTGPPPTAGVLDVRITATTSVLDRFGKGLLEVQEMVQGRGEDLGRKPYARVLDIQSDPHESPLFVVVDGVPYSPYGYRVTVFVHGLNGSSQVVRVAEDAWNPQVDLTVTPPAAFTLRVVDQEFQPYVDEDVTLIAVGEPRGRPLLQARTDTFGTALFEAVLAGEYDVKIGLDVRDQVTIERPGFVHDDLDVGVQSKQLKIPRGPSLTIEVFDIIQYALGGVRVRAIALDTTRNRRYEAQTDVNGVVRFDHVVPGRYQIDVQATGYQQTSRTLVVEAGQEVPPIQFKLPRLF